MDELECKSRITVNIMLLVTSNNNYKSADSLKTSNNLCSKFWVELILFFRISFNVWYWNWLQLNYNWFNSRYHALLTNHNRILRIVHDIEFNYFPPRLGSRFVVDWFLPFGYTNFDVEFGLVGQVIKLFMVHSRYWIDICSFLFLQITVEIPISKSIPSTLPEPQS